MLGSASYFEHDTFIFYCNCGECKPILIILAVVLLIKRGTKRCFTESVCAYHIHSYSKTKKQLLGCGVFYVIYTDVIYAE